MYESNYLSFRGSPRKYYRWFRGHTHGQIKDWFVPRSYISYFFAFLPTKVDDHWIWLSFYYQLKTVSDSTFSFGGTTTYSYTTQSRSKSWMKFKKVLKQEGIIRNLAKEKRESLEKIEQMPTWFKEKLIKG